jgi:phosphoribosyl-ATP pyrophosphohydrolase
MIIPSIDIRDGQTVQLIGGREQALSAGDPVPWAQRFGRVGPTAVIDLDAALGTGDNRAAIEGLLTLAPCTVGGGIRDLATARRWLDRGAERIVIGTAATPELLAQLPRERVLAALDARDGEVLSHGWQRGTGATIADRMAALRDLVGGFLVTVVEREGQLGGADLELARELKQAAGPARLIVAGGIATAAEVAALDRLGIDAQVGMALYTGRFDEADAIAACLETERADGLWPTIVCDESERALGLVWSSRESLRQAIATGRGVYHSRRRGVWEKGATSGDWQELRRIELDCDRDALRVIVRQHGRGFCHEGTTGCFGDARGLARLEATLRRRAANATDGSYTRRLLDDPALLAAKLGEEAAELAAAHEPDHVVRETADVLYFALVALQRAGRPLADVEAELDRRALAVTRRPGDAKPSREETP